MDILVQARSWLAIATRSHSNGASGAGHCGSSPTAAQPETAARPGIPALPASATNPSGVGGLGNGLHRGSGRVWRGAGPTMLAGVAFLVQVVLVEVSRGGRSPAGGLKIVSRISRISRMAWSNLSTAWRILPSAG